MQKHNLKDFFQLIRLRYVGSIRIFKLFNLIKYLDYAFKLAV